MFRRVFLRRLLLGVLGVAAAEELEADPGLLKRAFAPDTQTSPDVSLFRLKWPHADPIGWFEQQVGDLIVGVWADDTSEVWKVTAPPSWVNNKHGRVECVGCDQIVPRSKHAAGVN